MTATLSIDKAGRVVIPLTVRKMFGLNAGTALKMEIRERAVMLRPVEQRQSLVREDGVWVYDGTVTQDALLDAIASERDARSSAIWGAST